MNKPSVYSCVRMCSKTIRSSFLGYFTNIHSHHFVKSSPVVPYCDNSIAFVNSGMCQFKNIFLGENPPPYSRVVNSQKCIRVGGKHNDLSCAGRDNYHHTFFEMLGNWSFNDYYKKEACKMAFDYLTKPPLCLPLRQLYFTYFGGSELYDLPSDDETLNVWLELGVPKSQIIKEGMKCNFWEMGPTGPCGYSSEIHFDLRNEPSSALSRINKDFNDLFEIWNIVFISHNRVDSETITPLHRKYVDTGLGFERLVTILQNKSSTYDTDLFTPLLETISRVSKAKPYSGKFSTEDDIDTQYRLLSDYSRMITVALADNMFPDATPKLRNIVRDALLISEDVFKIKSGHLLCELSYSIAESLGETYPEIRQNMKKVQKILSEESRIFDNLRNTALKDWQYMLIAHPEYKHFDVLKEPGLVNGIKYLSKHFEKMSATEISGDTAFTLYDTYGLSKESINKIAEATGKSVNFMDFESHLKKLKEKSKQKSSLSNVPYINPNHLQGIPITDDSLKYQYTFDSKIGKYTFPVVNCTILGIIIGDSVFTVTKNKVIILASTKTKIDNIFVEKDSTVGFIFDVTNFYSEAGGQVDDRGFITLFRETHEDSAKVEIKNLIRIEDRLVHLGQIDSNFTITASTLSKLELNATHRSGCMRAHTTSHLINEALRQNLTCTYQKSCRVSSDVCAFDFSVYGENLNTENIIRVEKFINDLIKQGLAVTRRQINSSELLGLSNVTIIPGETYPESLTIVEVGVTKGDDGEVISREPCCGTHVENTKHIGSFCVVNYKSYNHGVRNIRCLTGESAREAIVDGIRIENECKQIQKNASDESLDADESALNQLRQNIRDVKQYLQYNKYNLPYTQQKHCEQILNEVSRSIKQKIRQLKKVTLANDIKKLMTTKQEPFAVHFIKDDDVDFQILPNITDYIDKPLMILYYSKSTLKARCYVPSNYINEDFHAEIWLNDIISYLRGKGAAIKGTDTRLVYNMDPIEINKSEIDKKIEHILEIVTNSVKRRFHLIK